MPELRRNLLSVRRITQKGFNVVFSSNSVLIVKEKEVIAEGYVEGDLFHFRFDVCRDEANVSECKLSYEQVHRRLGHPSLDVALKLRREGVISFSGDGNRLCEACIKGKLCQLPYPKSSFRTSRALEQIVSDVCQAPTRSYDGYDYFVTFLDTYTHFAMVYLLKNKNDVFGCFAEYEALVRAQFGYGISSFLCDNGREFINRDVIELCKSKGIRILNSVPYNHQQNGKAERLNRTLEDRCRTLLSDSGMPKIFWSEAILYSTYSLNRCPMLGTGKIPASEWYGGETGYHKLRPFGCVAYTHIVKEKRKKLDDRASKGIMVGYAPLAYRIYDLKSRKVVAARNVVFDEGNFYHDLFNGDDSCIKYPSDSSDEDSASEKEGDVRQTDITVSTPDHEAEGVLRRSTREQRPPVRLDDYEVTVEYCEALLMEDPLDSKWDSAKLAEIDSMDKFDV